MLVLCFGCGCGAQESLGMGREFGWRDGGRVVGVWGGVGAGAWSAGLDAWVTSINVGFGMWDWPVGREVPGALAAGFGP